MYVFMYLYITGPPERIKRGKIKYNAINLTAINLTWAEPFNSNSPITHYVVSCDKCPTPLSDVYTNVTVIVGLTPGVEYKLNVAAVNAIGSGQDSVNINAESATPGMNYKLDCIHIRVYEYASFVSLPPT